MQKPGMNRRSFLRQTGAAAGGASVVALAGCAGNGNGDDDTGNGNGNGNGDDDDDNGLDYPTDTVRSVVPYASGGGFDAYSRISEPYWEEYLGTDVTVENVTGGGGVTGGTQVYNADPDGYTKMIWAPGEALPSQIGQDVGYDIRELSHIGFMTQTPCALILREDTDIDDWDDFVDNVDSLNFATQGVGTMAHVGIDIMAELTGDFSREDANYVHYEGTGEVLAGLERGEADAFLITAGDSGANVVQGVEGTKLFLVFSEPEEIDWYFEQEGVDVDYYTPDIDTDGLDTMGTIAGMRRFYAGPPDVPQDILEYQREAFNDMIEDDDLLEDAMEGGRPIIEPGDHTVVEDVIEESYDLLSSEPYVSILEDAF